MRAATVQPMASAARTRIVPPTFQANIVIGDGMPRHYGFAPLF